MTELLDWFFNTWLTNDRVFLIYYMFNCGVQAMPEPNGEGWLYRWAFKFSHLVAGNTNLTRKNFSVKKGTELSAAIEAGFSRAMKRIDGEKQ